MKKTKYLVAVYLTALLPVIPLAAQSAAFDLGLTSSTQPDDSGVSWNRIGTWQTYKKANNVDPENRATSIVWETVSPLSFHYESDPEESKLDYPDFVVRDGLNLVRSGPVARTEAQVVLSGLKPDTLYDLIFYGSAPTGSKFDAAIQFSITEDSGKEHKDLLFVPYRDREAEITLSKIKSNSNGSLTIDLFLMDGYSRGNWSALKVFPSTNQ